MKAIVIRAYGGHEVMKLDDVELPAPGAGEALVDVAVSGVNFMDTGTRRGYTKAMHTLPMTPGVEGAGTVVAVGDGVTNVKVGDRVAWFFSWGSYAQQVIAPAAQLAPLPDDIDFATAASVMMQGLTANYFVSESYKIEPGRVALVHAAAGGVGLLLTQIIKLLGGRVIGRVSSEEKVAAAKSAGAEAVIVSKTAGFSDEVLRLTDGRGVDVVYDGTGAEGFADSVRCLDCFGTLVTFGPLMDRIPPIDIFSLPKNIKITYPSVVSAIRSNDQLLRYSAQLFDWVRSGRLKAQIGHRYPLAEAAQAHLDIESRRTTGKLLLLP
jgi:NADPH:quinone reductase